jgi:hypothetical protein
VAPSVYTSGLLTPRPDVIGVVNSRSPSLDQKLMMAHSFLPESPRYLTSKDRREEAFDILVHYHAERDRDSLFVKAEMVQIETTMKIELEASKITWMNMIRTP